MRLRVRASSSVWRAADRLLTRLIRGRAGTRRIVIGSHAGDRDWHSFGQPPAVNCRHVCHRPRHVHSPALLDPTTGATPDIPRHGLDRLSWDWNAFWFADLLPADCDLAA